VHVLLGRKSVLVLQCRCAHPGKLGLAIAVVIGQPLGSQELPVRSPVLGGNRKPTLTAAPIAFLLSSRLALLTLGAKAVHLLSVSSEVFQIRCLQLTTL